MKKNKNTMKCVKCNDQIKIITFWMNAEDNEPEETVVFCKNCVELNKITNNKAYVYK